MSSGKSKPFLLGAFLGSLAGAALGLLYAPEKGERMRKRLGDKKEKLQQKTQDFKAEIEKEIEKRGGVAKMVDSTLKEVSQTIQDLPITQNQQQEVKSPNLAKADKTPSRASKNKKRPRYFRGTSS